MPVVLSTGSSLIDAASILDAIGAHGAVFGDLRAGGHGHFVIAASKRYQEPGRIIALESYGPSVNALRSRLSEYGHDRVELLHADLESSRGVPLRDGELDVALLANSLHLFSAPIRALQETRRIVKQGGMVAVILPKQHPHSTHLRKPEESGKILRVVYSKTRDSFVNGDLRPVRIMSASSSRIHNVKGGS